MPSLHLFALSPAEPAILAVRLADGSSPAYYAPGPQGVASASAASLNPYTPDAVAAVDVASAHRNLLSVSSPYAPGPTSSSPYTPLSPSPSPSPYFFPFPYSPSPSAGFQDGRVEVQLTGGRWGTVSGQAGVLGASRKAAAPVALSGPSSGLKCPRARCARQARHPSCPKSCIPSPFCPPALQVCDTGFGDAEAQVVCRMTGRSGGRAKRGAPFGPGTVPVRVSAVKCKGTEANLTECQYSISANPKCTHAHDVGVECSSEWPGAAAGGRLGECLPTFGKHAVQWPPLLTTCALLQPCPRCQCAWPTASPPSKAAWR